MWRWLRGRMSADGGLASGPPSLRAEADAGAGGAAAQGDGGAVGSPAGGAFQGAVGGGVDGAHAAGDVAYSDGVVASGQQVVEDVFGDAAFDFQGVALGPDSGGLDGFLHGHSVVDQVGERLHDGGED